MVKRAIPNHVQLKPYNCCNISIVVASFLLIVCVMCACMCTCAVIIAVSKRLPKPFEGEKMQLIGNQ